MRCECHSWMIYVQEGPIVGSWVLVTTVGQLVKFSEYIIMWMKVKIWIHGSDQMSPVKY